MDKGEARVAGAPARAALTSGEPDDVVHGRIGLNHLFHIQNRVAHGLKGSVLRTLEPALEASSVLQWEKALGYTANQDDVQRQCRKQSYDYQNRMIERQGQRTAIAGEQQVEAVFKGAVDAVVLFGCLRFQQPGAHHRRHGERNQHGDGDRGGQNKGKLMEDAADNAPHEKDGDEDRDQRKAHGEDGKADLLRALQGGFHGGHA